MKKTALTIFMLASLSANSQVFIEGGAGITNKYLSSEVQTGVRVNNITASIGFISLPDGSQPALFNFRAGYTIKERWLIYAGYVRLMRSSDNKAENGDTWQTGVQYHFMHYDRGTFYVEGNYSPSFISLHLGMSFNKLKN
jgi:hypothetical protein